MNTADPLKVRVAQLAADVAKKAWMHHEMTVSEQKSYDRWKYGSYVGYAVIIATSLSMTQVNSDAQTKLASFLTGFCPIIVYIAKVLFNKKIDPKFIAHGDLAQDYNQLINSMHTALAGTITQDELREFQTTVAKLSAESNKYPIHSEIMNGWQKYAHTKGITDETAVDRIVKLVVGPQSSNSSEHVAIEMQQVTEPAVVQQPSVNSAMLPQPAEPAKPAEFAELQQPVEEDEKTSGRESLTSTLRSLRHEKRYDPEKLNHLIARLHDMTHNES